MTQEIFMELIKNGFNISFENNKFVVRKINVPNNSTIIESREFDDYSFALEFAEKQLKKNREWQPIVRYNRGLGIEYKNLSIITASSKEEAQKIATTQAEICLKDLVTILEVKVFSKI